MTRRVIILGLDGATFDIIDPLISSGKLPNVARLMEGGFRSQLVSTVHPLTPAAWSSMVTGKNPGKHGVYDFYRRKRGGYRMELVNARLRSSEALWGILSRQGKRVGVLNVPITYPPDTVNGFVVSGMDTPSLESRFTFPESLRADLVQAVDGYMIDADQPCTVEEEYLELVTAMLRKRLDALHFLLGRFPDLDFLMATFVATDRLQHAFWKYIDPASPDYSLPGASHFRSALESCFQQIDDLVGELKTQVGEDGAIFIVSDHGFGPLRKDVYLNRFLADLGLLKFNDGELRLGPECLETLDWDKTKAYSFGYFGNININLKGREPAGSVDPGREAEQLKALISSEMLKLSDPETGEPLGGQVWRREELYSGQFIEAAPDMLVCMRDYEYMTRGDYEAVRTSLVGPPMKYHRNAIKHSGNHRLEGVLIGYGNGLRSGVRLEASGIADITPTVLYYLGLPVPADMDGKVLLEAFDPAFRNGNAVHFEEAQPRPALVSTASPGTAATKRLLEEQGFQLRRLGEDLAAANAKVKIMEEERAAMPALHEYVRHLERVVAERDWTIAQFQRRSSVGISPGTVLRSLAGRLRSISPSATAPEGRPVGEIRVNELSPCRPADVSIIIPTKNAGEGFGEVLRRVFGQRTELAFEVLVIDSGSSDCTVAIAEEFPVRLVHIAPDEFNHGATRNLGAGLASGRFLVFTVQDAWPGDSEWLDSLVAPLVADESIAGSYSRQEPFPWADIFTKDLHQVSGSNSWTECIKCAEGKEGFASLSPEEQLTLARFDNVSSCVRKSTWHQFKFPVADFAEDLTWGKMAIERGYKLAYQPRSFVLHSHSRSLLHDYRRAYLSGRAYKQLFGIQRIKSRHDFVDDFRGCLYHRWDVAREVGQPVRQRAATEVRAFLLTAVETVGRWRGAKWKGR